MSGGQAPSRGIAAARRRRVLPVVSGLAVLVAAAALFASRHALLERWHLHRLESDRPETRRDAAMALSRLGSKRGAIACLVAGAREPEPGTYLEAILGFPPEALGPALLAVREEQPEVEKRWIREIGASFQRMFRDLGLPGADREVREWEDVESMLQELRDLAEQLK